MKKCFKFNKKNIFLIVIILTVSLLLVIIFLHNNNEKTLINEKFIQQKTSDLPQNNQYTESIDTRIMKELWWEDYEYNNNFNKIIMDLGNMDNYEEISNLLLYSSCYSLNKITYYCYNRWLLDLFLKNTNAYTISIDNNTYYIANKNNDKKMKIVLWKDENSIFIMLMK